MEYDRVLYFYRGKLHCDNYLYRFIAQPYVHVKSCPSGHHYKLERMNILHLNPQLECKQKKKKNLTELLEQLLLQH